MTFREIILKFLPKNFLQRWISALLFGFSMTLFGIFTLLLVLFSPKLLPFLESLAGQSENKLFFIIIVLGLLASSGFILLYSLFKLGTLYKDVIKTQPGITEMVIENYQLTKGPKIVAIGGGTGLATLLMGLKNFTSNITAIVTVTDDGGSSGRLREEMGILPPGDIRNCLCALAQTEPLMNQLFKVRFDKGGLSGHNFGNLFIAAMHEIMGDFAKSVKASSQILNIRGTVLPVSNDHFNIGAHFQNGSQLIGETKIVRNKQPIRSIFLVPPDVTPLREAVEAIEKADMILLGPGSLFTSVIPNLLVRGVAEAINSHAGYRIYICNVMTQPGETDGFTAADHVKTLFAQTPLKHLDYVAINTQRISENLLENYRQSGAEGVKPDIGEILSMGVKVINGDMIDMKEVVRHSPRKLARILLNLIEPDKVPLTVVKRENLA